MMNDYLSRIIIYIIYHDEPLFMLRLTVTT